MDICYKKLKQEYHSLNGKKILDTIYDMCSKLKMNEQEVDKANRTMNKVMWINTCIDFIAKLITYIGCLFILPIIVKMAVDVVMAIHPYLAFVVIAVVPMVVASVCFFIESVFLGSIVAPIVEETSKLVYSNERFITKYVQMFNLDENMLYYIRKKGKKVYYDVDVGILRMRTQVMHIISSYVMKTKNTFNSKFLSYLTAICIHSIFNFCASIPGKLGYKLWLAYNEHLVNKYGHLLDEYRKDIEEINKQKKSKVSEGYEYILIHRKKRPSLKRCLANNVYLN